MNAPLGAKTVRPYRPMGAILVEAGRLAAEDAERILDVQRDKGMRFGEAAKFLKMLSDEDIDYALARQFDYPYLKPGSSLLSGELVAAYAPFTPVVETLRAVRSQLALRWFGQADRPRALTIVSARPSEGRSWVAANLAVVFSQLGERTLLIDGDLRQPRQHKLFGIANQVGLATLLSGRHVESAIQPIPELRELSVLPAGSAAPNPQELLMRPLFSSFLERLRGVYDVIIIDTPPVTEYADAQMLAVRAGAALVVAAERGSRVAELQRMAEDMRDSGARIVGSLINRH